MGPIAGGRIDIPIEPDLRGFDSKLGAGLRKSTGAVGNIIKGLGVAVAAGAAVAVVGLKSAIDAGKVYQSNLNELQAVTQATALDMRRVGDTAKALGADMTLPATSAADAAAAMVELAKGGLSVNDAMKAAKGTLQLAAAAQVDAAQAAEIQSNALNEFGLAADQAGHVADVLANTANAASGSIVDMANALKFVGPVAKGLGVSIDSVSTAIGLLANNGIQGEQAGTSLRGILASLASPSKQAAKAMKELGIVAFDQKGQFVGLRTITEQLAKAKGNLSQEEFAAAASTAFGNEGFTAANALANEGAKAFDEMATAVSRAGGAADVAGAKTKGLGGAIEGFKSQVETAGLGVFEAISGPLEAGVRKAADVVAAATPAVVSGIEHLVAAGQVFGPRLADALKDRASVVGDAVHDVLGPIAATIPDILNVGVNAAIGLWEDFTGVLKKGVEAAKPAARGLADIAKAATESDGPLSAAAAGLGLIGDGAKLAAGLLVPIGKIVGGIASAFADLPGPIQTAAIALGLVAAFKGPLGSLGDTVKDRVTGPFRNLGEQVRLQQALFDGSTGSIGKFGGALAALESNIPVLQKMRSAFEEGSTGAERFNRTAGLAAAAGAGIKSAASGILSAFGGPWGAAIAGVSVGLSLLAGANAKAAQEEADHKRRVETLSDALRESKGVIDDNVRSLAAKALEDSGAAKSARELGIPLDVLTNAYLGNKGALDQVNAALDVYINQTQNQGQLEGQVAGQNPLADKAFELKKKLAGLSTEFEVSEERRRRFDEAIRTGNVSLLDATGAGKDFASAMGVLRDNTSSADDKVRAIKQALDALSGGQVDLEAAQAKLHEGLQRLTEGFKSNGTAADDARRNADGYGKALINANGSVNTTLPNGRRLLDFLRDQSGVMAEVAQRTFETARAQGDDLPTALGKAKLSSQQARQEFINAADTMGLTADQAAALADRYNLVPDQIATLITAPGMDKTSLELLTLRDLINKVPADKPITVRTLSDEAKKKLEDLGFIVKTLPDGQVQIVAKDQSARDKLNNLVADFQNRQIVLNVTARVTASLSQAAATIRGIFGHDGMIVRAFADGGVQRVATPFSAGIPQIFPPNMLRFTGDRNKDDEFYIPDDEQPRSYALAQEWARRHSMTMVRSFALGGIAQGGGVAPAPVGARGGEFTGTLVLDSGELLGVIRGEIRETNRETRRRVLAGARGQL